LGQKKTEIFLAAGLDRPNHLEAVTENRVIARIDLRRRSGRIVQKTDTSGALAHVKTSRRLLLSWNVAATPILKSYVPTRHLKITCDWSMIRKRGNRFSEKIMLEP
jgi:hypothetical protein